MKEAIIIIKESLKISILAAVISSMGGIAIERISEKIILFLPLLIMIPALNNMMGGFGIIIVSKFTTSLFEHKIKSPWYHSHFIKHLFREVFPSGIICSVYISFLTLIVSGIQGSGFSLILFLKILALVLISTMSIIIIIFLISILGGLYIYHKKQDPDNILIPITTAIADMGSMVIFAILVVYLF